MAARARFASGKAGSAFGVPNRILPTLIPGFNFPALVRNYFNVSPHVTLLRFYANAAPSGTSPTAGPDHCLIRDSRAASTHLIEAGHLLNYRFVGPRRS
jgi:hypothetical protein